MSDSTRQTTVALEDPGMGQTAIGVAEVGVASSTDGPTGDGVIRSGRLKGLTMWKAIRVLAFPVVCESLLQTLVGLVDTALASGVSEAAADAIGGATYFLWFIMLIGAAISVGTTALISRAVGKGRLAVANTAVAQSLIAALSSGVVVGAIVWLMAPLCADWLSLKDQARQMGIDFLRINSLGVPATTVLTAGIACCRGVGDNMAPLFTMMAVNAVNFVVSFLLAGVDLAVSHLDKATGEVVKRVLVHPPLELHLGVKGIAIGTVTAWTFGAIIITALLLRGRHGVRLRLDRLSIHWHTMMRMVRVGAPNLAETFGMWLGNFATILMVGWMHSPGYMGAHLVAIRIEAFSFMPGFAIGTAAATLVGQYLGARSVKLATLAISRCALVASILMGLWGAFFCVAPATVVGLFTQQPTHLTVVPELLFITGLVQIPFAMHIVARLGMRGAGDTKAVACIMWISTYLVRLPLAWLCSGVEIPLGNGHSIPNPAPLQKWWGINPLAGFWIGLCVEMVIRGALYWWRFLSGRWARIKV